MTLKCGKCQLKMTEFGFISRTLSARRIGTPDVKVKTVNDVREPKNAAKVRSIIGLVNITEYFFSDNNICTSPTTYHLWKEVCGIFKLHMAFFFLLGPKMGTICKWPFKKYLQGNGIEHRKTAL